MPKRKILFFLPNSVGGAERVTITIAKMLDVEKYDVMFVVVGRSLGDIVKFIPENYDTKLLHVFNIWDFAICKMVRLLKKERPQVVFSSLRYLNVRVIAASNMVGGIKTVVRNENTLRTLNMLNFYLVKCSYPKADIVVAQQEEMKKEIIDEIKLPDDKVVVLHNPLDTESIDKKLETSTNPYPKVEGIKYVWVGRIGRHKGQDVLIKAFNIVHEKNNNSHLYFVGQYSENDNYYRAICDETTNLGLQNFVHFVGYTDNPYAWMKYADCFVLPSRNEGLPNSLIEAMYIGKPVVATTCIPVIERIVNDGINGILVKSEDYEAMAEAMLNAVDLKTGQTCYVPSSSKDICKLFE